MWTERGFEDSSLFGTSAPGRVTSRFAELRDELGLQGVRFRHLRRFAATVMLAGGGDVRTVAGRLRHSRPTLTLQTYAHNLEVTDRRAAEIVGGSIATAPGVRSEDW